MIQYILVGLLLLWAVYYIVQLLRKQFTSKSACASNCGKCGIDMSKLDQSINPNK